LYAGKTLLAYGKNEKIRGVGTLYSLKLVVLLDRHASRHATLAAKGFLRRRRFAPLTILSQLR